MRLANVEGRSAAVLDGSFIDIERWSGGLFEANPMALLNRWSEFNNWYSRTPLPSNMQPVAEKPIGPPVPQSRQVFAVANNYSGRVAVVEGSADLPIVFTKFASSISGPYGSLPLPSSTVDWEVEVVVVIGEPALNVDPSDGWSKVAGITVGQDFSERTLQLGGASKQFSLGKSYANFGPIGPVMVTPDELLDRNNIRLGCSVNGEVVQDSSTNLMIFSVPELISRLSCVCRLLPGDLIFTGTPAGMGMTMHPPRYLRVGDVVESWVEGIGSMRNQCVPPKALRDQVKDSP